MIKFDDWYEDYVNGIDCDEARGALYFLQKHCESLAAIVVDYREVIALQNEQADKLKAHIKVLEADYDNLYERFECDM